MLKDIKNVMGSKRLTSDDMSTTRATLMNVSTGQKIPIEDDTEFIIGRALTSTYIIEELFISRRHCVIKYENNRFFITDLHSSSGTFLNCVHLSRNINHRTELQQGDLIGFGDANKIAITLKFILHPITNKKPRLDNEHEEENIKHIIAKLHSEILSLSVDRIILRNKTKTNVAELLKLHNNIMEMSIKQTAELNNTIHELRDQVTKLQLQLDGNSAKELQLKEQLYCNLENEFQCSICSELVYKATNLSCNHTFCELCIHTWRKKNNVCPVCRASILSITRCLALDNYINKTCDFMGGSIKEQRQLLLKERTVVHIPCARRGRKKTGAAATRALARRNELLPLLEDNLVENFMQGIEIVDLTHSYTL